MKNLRTILLLTLCAIILAAFIPGGYAEGTQGKNDASSQAGAPETVHVILIPYLQAGGNNTVTAAKPVLEGVEEMLTLVQTDREVKVTIIPKNVSKEVQHVKAGHIVGSLTLNKETGTGNFSDRIKKAVDEIDAAGDVDDTLVIILDFGNGKTNWNNQLSNLTAKGAEVYVLETPTVSPPSSVPDLNTYVKSVFGDSTGAKWNTLLTANNDPRRHLFMIEDQTKLSDILFQTVQYLLPTEDMERLEPITVTDEASADSETVYQYNTFAPINEQTVWLVQGNLKDADLTITDENGEPISAVPALEAPEYIQLLTAEGGHNQLKLKADGISGVYLRSVEKDVDYQIYLENLTDKDEIDRNDTIQLTIGLSGNISGEELNKQGISPELIVDDDGTVSVEIKWNSVIGKWEANPKIDKPVSRISARLSIPGIDEPFTSDPVTVNVRNHKPEIESEYDQIQWSNNPFLAPDERKTLKLKLTVTDADGDVPELTVKDTTLSGFARSITTEADPDDQNVRYVVITLIDEPTIEQEFTVSVEAYDGIDRTPFEVKVTLYSLEDEIGKFIVDPIEIFQRESAVNQDAQPIEIAKKIPVKISFAVRCADDSMQQRQALSEFAKHIVYRIQIVKDEKSDLPLEDMECDSNETAFLRWNLDEKVDDAGSFTVGIIPYEKTDDSSREAPSWPKPAQIPFVAKGSAPNRNSGVEDKFETYYMQYDLSGFDIQKLFSGEFRETYNTENISIQNLFTDPDGDEISILVQVKDENGQLLRLERSKEGLLTVTEEVGTDPVEIEATETLSLRFMNKGVYQLVLSAKDQQDGEGNDTVIYTYTILSIQEKLLLYAGIGVAALILLLIILRLLRPKFKGSVSVLEETAEWKQETLVSVDGWGKKKQPVAMLLTCAACHSSSEAYTMLQDVIMKPTRHGIRLIGKNLEKVSAGGRKTALLDSDNSFTAQTDTVTVIFDYKGDA